MKLDIESQNNMIREQPELASRQCLPSPDPTLGTTNAQLILRLADPEDQSAWDAFVGIYEPLILRSVRRLGLNEGDAHDATQEVLAHLAKVVSSWRPNGRKGAFRRWLLQVARNQTLKLIQRTTMLRSESGGSAAQALLNLKSQVGGNVAADDSSFFDIEYRRQVFHEVVKRLRCRHHPKTWNAFWKTFIDEQSPQTVADELEISVGAVYIARSRVMDSLRTETKKLLAADPSEGELPVSAASLSSLRRVTVDGEVASENPTELVKA